MNTGAIFYCVKVKALELSADGGANLDRGIQHLWKYQVHSEDRLTRYLQWDFKALHRSADEGVLIVSFDCRLLRKSHGGRFCGNLSISQRAPGRTVSDHAILRGDRLDRHAPLLGCGEFQPFSRARTGLLQWHPPEPK